MNKMKEFSDEQLNALVNKLASELVKRIYGIQNPKEQTQPFEGDDMIWYADRDDDHVIGELARLMTLMNIYEEREEYEKCHLLKGHIDRLNKIVENL